ncbi:hypothetical protein OG308_16055 [Nocardia salmonicida]|uniref:Uncharacterized protein n=1 Tax=Nocardia salmonicida TaxID=53431 RepID=A0ABZ1NGT4_9NOCA
MRGSSGCGFCRAASNFRSNTTPPFLVGDSAAATDRDLNYLDQLVEALELGGNQTPRSTSPTSTCTTEPSANSRARTTALDEAAFSQIHTLNSSSGPMACPPEFVSLSSALSRNTLVRLRYLLSISIVLQRFTAKATSYSAPMGLVGPRPGAQADLTVLDGDPVQDLAFLTAPGRTGTYVT